jgi:hypothetical protein
MPHVWKLSVCSTCLAVKDEYFFDIFAELVFLFLCFDCYVHLFIALNIALDLFE